MISFYNTVICFTCINTHVVFIDFYFCRNKPIMFGNRIWKLFPPVFAKAHNFYNTVYSRRKCAYVLFGLISPELILSKMQAEACECTLTISYTNAYRTCGICGATMRTRQEIPAFFYREGSYEGILKSGIEVKVSSEGCLAKMCSSCTGQKIHIFDNDTSGENPVKFG